METATNPVCFLRSLKGAPLSVLIAIRIFPGPASLLQLAAATGYDQHTCARATQALEAMGFLQRAHYRGWQLTSAAQQLPLWTPSEIGEVETSAPVLLDEPKRANLAFQPLAGGPQLADAPETDEHAAKSKRAFLAFQQTTAEPPLEPDEAADDAPNPKRANHAFQDDADSLKRVNLAFQPADGGSGGGLINTNTRDEDPHQPPPPPTHAREPKRAKYAFQPDEEDLLADLIDLTGCPRHRAEEAVAAARSTGYSPAWLHLQVLRWHAYLADGRAKSIHNPGYFVAKKLEDGEACPFDDVKPSHADQARFLEWRLDDAQRGPDDPAAEADEPADREITPPQAPFWETAKRLLRLQLPAEAFSTWIASATANRMDPDQVVIRCQSEAQAEVLRLRLHTRIQAALDSVLGARTAVTYLAPAAEGV